MPGYPCCCYGCEYCEDRKSSSEVAITLALVADRGGFGGCSTCDENVNDTFVISLSIDRCTFYSGSFGYGFGQCWGFTLWAFFLDHVLKVEVTSGLTVIARFSKDYGVGNKVPCSTLSGESLPLTYESGSGCVFTGATCTVTAF